MCSAPGIHLVAPRIRVTFWSFAPVDDEVWLDSSGLSAQHSRNVGVIGEPEVESEMLNGETQVRQGVRCWAPDPGEDAFAGWFPHGPASGPGLGRIDQSTSTQPVELQKSWNLGYRCTSYD